MAQRTVIFAMLISAAFVSSKAFAETGAAGKKIAVVQGKFDRVEAVLAQYRIPHTVISYNDLAKKGSLDGYRAIFFPCGADKPIESNIDVTASGYYVRKVSLKTPPSRIDRQAIFDNIHEFVAQGGSAYFSDYAYDLAQGAFDCFEFHHNFPNLGMQGTFQADLTDELYRFTRRDRMDVHMPHSGWVLLKSAKNARVLARGNVDTPKGEAGGPLVLLLERGDGECIYTSYHTHSATDEIMRYIVLRIALGGSLKHYAGEIAKWNQTVRSDTIDLLLPGEWARRHYVTLSRGKNTLYFYAPRGLFQVDLFDREMNLVISRDADAGAFAMDVKAEYDGEYILAVYTHGEHVYVPFSVVTASGWRLVPYVSALRVLAALAALFVLAVIVTAFRISNPKESGGRIRR